MYQPRRFWRATVVVFALVFGAASLAGSQAAKSQKAKPKAAVHAASFRVSAPDFVSKGRIDLTHVYNGMGCTGQNISPALEWSNPPAGTER